MADGSGIRRRVLAFAREPLAELRAGGNYAPSLAVGTSSFSSQHASQSESRRMKADLIKELDGLASESLFVQQELRCMHEVGELFDYIAVMWDLAPPESRVQESSCDKTDSRRRRERRAFAAMASIQALNQGLIVQRKARDLVGVALAEFDTLSPHAVSSSTLEFSSP